MLDCGLRRLVGMSELCMKKGFLAWFDPLAYTAIEPLGLTVRLYIMVTLSGSNTVGCPFTVLPQEDYRDAPSSRSCRRS